MKKENLVFIGVALVVGILLGILFSKGGKAPVKTPVSLPKQPAVNFQQNIEALKEIVIRQPSNRNAWVQLGHNYFDSDQPMEAIEAYNKALEVEPDDSDVLTDQGIMFRRIGWFDKAVENFQKASQLNPSHAQSLYNLGVTYRYDLADFAKAKEAWSKFLVLNPTGAGADRVRAELEFIENHTEVPK